ncbi:MAG: hypothetical protein C5B57_11390 [Blastocatellia bacterium]|nr:MAG: hypothetical protein C5B57_11390 [Blastocatellia bacterium]
MIAAGPQQDSADFSETACLDSKARSTVARVLLIGAVLPWTLAVTALRATRLPNDFSTEHWFIDYRFGLVKRGLVGSLVSLATASLRTQPTEQLVAVLSVGIFVFFCVVLLYVGLRVIRQSQWSTAAILSVLAFFSSPFVVMSAHLIGYYDNIVIILGVVSIALLLRGKSWSAASLQVVAMLVHENALLVIFPAFCFSWFLAGSRMRSEGSRASIWPLVAPLGTFFALALSQGLSSNHLEQALTEYLSTYPFIERSIRSVRVPHWITITFLESYSLHQGKFLGRILSQSMLGLVLPSTLAILATAFDAYRIRVVSWATLIVLGACLAPQMMHLVAWDTARIWTYSILDVFLVLWVCAEVVPTRPQSSEFAKLGCLIALVLNAAELTPLMDGLRDHFELQTRLLLYTPVLATALIAILREELVPLRRAFAIDIPSGGRPPY